MSSDTHHRGAETGPTRDGGYGRSAPPRGPRRGADGSRARSSSPGSELGAGRRITRILVALLWRLTREGYESRHMSLIEIARSPPLTLYMDPPVTLDVVMGVGRIRVRDHQCRVVYSFAANCMNRGKQQSRNTISISASTRSAGFRSSSVPLFSLPSIMSAKGDDYSLNRFSRHRTAPPGRAQT
jgi:hypothetical protein